MYMMVADVRYGDPCQPEWMSDRRYNQHQQAHHMHSKICWLTEYNVNRTKNTDRLPEVMGRCPNTRLSAMIQTQRHFFAFIALRLRLFCEICRQNLATQSGIQAARAIGLKMQCMPDAGKQKADTE